MAFSSESIDEINLLLQFDPNNNQAGISGAWICKLCASRLRMSSASKLWDFIVVMRYSSPMSTNGSMQTNAVNGWRISSSGSLKKRLRTCVFLVFGKLFSEWVFMVSDVYLRPWKVTSNSMFTVAGCELPSLHHLRDRASHQGSQVRDVQSLPCIHQLSQLR